ncbi:MAG: prefoldin subunit alpha [Thermoplasmata archaeon]|jgi:prefoldin alpha subunit|nr:MAG: prefoldin subunit alpha [Thermoplasmata archaeon]RLF64691.1 MAG: prefoldin subunit alpha [Thermoplasmata archaeon]
MEAEENKSRDLFLLQEYQERMDAIYQQVTIIEELLGEYRRVKSALEEISKAKKGEELLVPIGGNIFIHASLNDTSNVMAGVGGGVVTEKSINKAMTFVDKKIEELLKEEENLVKTSQEIRGKVEDISARLREAERKD